MNLKKSKELVVIKKGENYIVYHKFYGNLSILSYDSYQLLNSFSKSIDPKEIISNDEVKEFIEIFKDNFFLIEEDYEEFELLNAEKEYRNNNYSSGYLVKCLQLVLTNSCNFSCKYCFQNDSKNDERDIKSCINMDIPTAVKSVLLTIELLKENNNKLLTIEFFGGEPLVNWKTIKGVFDYFKNGSDFGIDIFYTITTNGSLLNEEIVDYFNTYNCHVALSFDSPSGDKRVLKNGVDAKDIIVSKFDLLKQRNVSTSINSVLSKYTLENYDGKALVDFALAYKCKSIGLILDLDADLYSKEYNKKEFIDNLWDTYLYGESEGVQITGYWEKVFGLISGRDQHPLESGFKGCPATGSKVSVEPNGDLYICKCCVKKIGKISNLKESLSSERYREYSKRVYFNHESCTGCDLEGFCSGICMGSLEKQKNTMFGIEPNLCYIYKNITKKLILNTELIEKIGVI